jgi:formate dehydrogenase major subunit
MVRDTKGGELRPATWDEALDRVVAGFQAARAAHGPTTFGTFSCSKATNEVNFAAQKFSRVVDLTRPERRRSGDRVRCRWRHKFIP